MKCVYFFRKATAIILSSMFLLILSYCSQNRDVFGAHASSAHSSSQILSKKAFFGSKVEENQISRVKSSPVGYKMLLYTKLPNKNSSIKIQYPSFFGNNFDALNTLVYDKVKSFAKIETSLYSSDTGLNINYQSAVTLQNSKIVSIVFWGSSYMEGGTYPVNNLISLNVDIHSMKEITLKDLYLTNEDFEKVFFDKAFFPTNPITSYDKVSFPEMLKLQSPEYQTINPFKIPDNVSFFLKPDGIVLSMPAIHATGYDHFEAQLKYSDIQQFYLLKQNYWEN